MKREDFIKLKVDDRIELKTDLPGLPKGTLGAIIQGPHGDGQTPLIFVEIAFNEHPKGARFHHAVYTWSEMDASRIEKLGMGKKAKKGKDADQAAA